VVRKGRALHVSSLNFRTHPMIRDRRLTMPRGRFVDREALTFGAGQAMV
jgi:hypothetical protein